ncbi:hypothetical protein ACFL56_03345 [Candidatus Margulisiibacteriota bacterium]
MLFIILGLAMIVGVLFTIYLGVKNKYNAGEVLAALVLFNILAIAIAFIIYGAVFAL